MSDPDHRNMISSQLIALLRVPVLPKGSFPKMFAQNREFLFDEGEVIRNEEYRVLKKATASLKRSNAVPQAMELETIELFRRKCSGDISQNNDYIQHLQSQINNILEELRAMHGKQLRIQDLLDYFKPICSPVRRLPPEILTTIFQFCTPTNAGPRSDVPLVLCHVSSLWRSVALGSQQLWRTLFVDFRQTSASKYGEISKFWFRNSQNQPRSLRYRHEYSFNRQPGLQQWTEDLRASSKLLRTLKCIHIHPELLLPFLRLPSSDVPLLEVVHLSCVSECDEAIKVLEAAPRLRVVHLDMFSYSFAAALPWSQLTWLKIQGFMDAAYWTVVFPKCLQLQYGSFRIFFMSGGNFALAPQSTLEHLETLYLAIEDEWNLFQDYFQKLNLPRLRHFSLTGELVPGPISNLSFCDMKPCPTLTSLCLQRWHMEEDVLTSLLTTMPTLECLALDITAFDYPSISALLHKNCAMLPSLSRLYLIMSSYDLTLGPKGICSAIKSRFHANASSFVSLKHMSLFLHRDGRGEDEEENNAGSDEEDSELEFTMADRATKASGVIKSSPHADGVDIHIGFSHEPPELAYIVEEIYCKSPQDY